MYNISFHLKLYRIIYWTKKYSPKLRFHNKVVYKCKSLSKWWLWACKSTFYLIKKGRICGPCETKHDKPNRLAIHCYGIYSQLNSTLHPFLNKILIAHISYTYLPIYNKSLLIVVDDIIVKNEIIRPRISMLEALPLRISWKFILK